MWQRKHSTVNELKIDWWFSISWIFSIHEFIYCSIKDNQNDYELKKKLNFFLWLYNDLWF